MFPPWMLVELWCALRAWWDERRERRYDYDSRDELYEVPPLVIPVRPRSFTLGEALDLDRMNAKARKASFATHVRAELWAQAQMKKHPNYSWGYTIQTREGTKREGAKPWYVRFTDK